MFSGITLLILAGLLLLGLACTLFPLAPTSRFGIILFLSYTFYFITTWFIALPAFTGILIALIFIPFFIADALLAHQNIRVLREIPSQLARGVPAEFNIRISDKNYDSTKFIKTQIRQPSCADITLSDQESNDFIQGTITAHRRGRYQIPPFATRISGPLGFATWHRPDKNAHEVKVFPDLPAAYRLAHSIQQGRFSAEGLKRRGPLGLGTNFESVRDYFPDDDIRNVNWSAMAKMRRPMTNQYRVEQDKDVIALIDTGRLMSAPLPLNKPIDFEEQPEKEDQVDSRIFATRLDVALDAVCGLVSAADVMGDRSGVIAFNSKIDKHLKPRRAGARSVIRTIFDLETAPKDADYEAACQRIGKAKRSYVLIFTDFLDAQSARPLARALSGVVRKHRVVVAGIIDPEILELLEKKPNDFPLNQGLNEMQRSALEAVDVLKNVGAEVIYANHDELMTQCVKSYLGAKQRATF